MTVHPVPIWQRALIILSGTVVGFIIVLGLQWGRPVLIPVALAVLLTFLLNPIVKTLHRRGLGRVLSVMLAVSTAGILLMCLGWMVTKQVTGMLAELPQNTDKIKAKVKTLKQLGSGPTNEQFGRMIEEIIEEFRVPVGQARNSPQEDTVDARPDVDPHTGTIVMRPEPMRWLSLTGYLGSAFEVLATLAFALVLLVFFLIEREDLRDRIVLMAGRTKLAMSSKALEDVTDRVSRYIGMVALVNSGFGLVLTLGLLVLHVPYALLWGFIAATLRFIPYIGPWIGAIFPITMSLAMSDGWWQPLAVLAFVTVVELVTNNVIEPLLFGHTTGVSPTALLVSAACWLYLWGPIGLVLSAPFAVCLVVLGKNIPELGFFYLILGDKPALNADYNFYQRLMLGDYHEAAALAINRLKTSPSEDIYDEMLIPALNYTNRDVRRNYLNDDEQRAILEGIRESLVQIGESQQASNKDEIRHVRETVNDESAESTILAKPATILGCPATDDTDRVALEMLRQLVDSSRWELEITSLETLTSELISRILESPPALVFIASIPPGGLAHSRYLCKRLRSASPDLQIVVGRCGQKRYARRDREQLIRAGANFVTTSLLESRNLLNARRPLLASQNAAVNDLEIQHAAPNFGPGSIRQIFDDGTLESVVAPHF